MTELCNGWARVHHDTDAPLIKANIEYKTGTTRTLKLCPNCSMFLMAEYWSGDPTSVVKTLEWEDIDE